MRLSALKNAARISPFVSGVTIGPNSIFQGSNSNITVSFKNDLAQPEKEKPVGKIKQVRVTFNTNEDSRKVEIVNSPKNKLDLATINQKAVMHSAEKKQKEIVKKELFERNIRLIEEDKKIQSRVQAARIESHKKIQLKEQKNEKLLQEHFNQMDSADRVRFFHLYNFCVKLIILL